MPKLGLPFYARNMMIIWTTLLLIGLSLCMVAAAWFMFTDIKHPA